MELDIFDQADALIGHWLGQPPAADDEDYFKQTRQALWLEERHYESMARILGVKK